MGRLNTLPTGVTNSRIALGDNKECNIIGEGTIIVTRYANGEWTRARIENVLYVPQIKRNLFSVGVCTSKGYKVVFRDDSVVFRKGSEVMACGIKQNNEIYRLLFKVSCVKSDCEVNVSSVDLQTWHERLGHLNDRKLRELIKKGLVDESKVLNKDKFFCNACPLGKSHRIKFNKSRNREATVPGEVFHTDVCGKMPVESPGGSRYLLTFKDDATSFRVIYFLKHKSDVFEQFKVSDKLVENKFGKPMRILRSDNGTEFCNANMNKYLESRGIQRETTAPYTPEQNGKSERDNRTIIESARTMLLAKDLPPTLWAEATNTAVYIMNRTSKSAAGDITPYELWVGKQPSLDHIRIFGSEAYMHIPKQLTTKFDAKSKRVILVGYARDSTNYRLYDPVTKKVLTSRDVIFNEKNEKLITKDERDEGVILPKIEDSQDIENQVESEENEHLFDVIDPGVPIYPQENEDLPILGQPINVRELRNRDNIKKPARYEINVAEASAPDTYQEALSCKESTNWIQAIKNELNAHRKNKTWSVIPRKPGMKTIDSKWVFEVLKDNEGKIQRFKARLCARGFMQQQGIDYTETFAPVVRYDSLRVFLSIVAVEDLELIQFDVETAFLHGVLEEKIFMEIPEGLQVKSVKSVKENSDMNVVCLLNKSLYGLKQAPRCWNDKFCDFLKRYNFEETEADKCIFVGQVGQAIVYLALFVDDGLLAAKSKEHLNIVLKHLRNEFSITVGDSSIFVGMQIERDRTRKSVFLHQKLYVEEVLIKFGMQSAKPVAVPSDPNVVLYPVDKNEIEIENKVPYREAVGSLMFLAVVSRPDIAYAVNLVSKFLSNHNDEHWRAVKRILAYLVGTKNHGIEFCNGESNLNLEGYSDADYAGDVGTRRSTSGYVFKIANGPVTWSSQRQKLVTLSTTESEYVAAAAAAREAIWLRKLLCGMGYERKNETVIYIDNQSAIRLVRNAEFHKRTKHIDIKYHYIREKAHDKEIVVHYVPSGLQEADIFSKALPRERFRMLCDSMNCKPRSTGESIAVV